MMAARGWCAAALLAGAVMAVGGGAGAAPDAGCPAEVREALTSWGEDGVHRQVAVIRAEATGISQPESVFDFSCLDDLFRFPGLYVMFDPSAVINAILRAMQDFVCESGEALYDQHVDQPLEEMVFWDEFPYVPGVDVDAPWRDKGVPVDVDIREGEAIGASEGRYRDARWFRRAIGG